MTPIANKHLPVALRGYDRVQVDDLLGRISRALDGRDGMNADAVRAARFDVVVRGYDRVAVDDLLAECVRELRGPEEDGAVPAVHADWLVRWIQSVQFTGSRLRLGYDVRDVDAFLDRVIGGLRGEAPQVSSRDVRECTFACVRLGPSYDEREVDEFLRQLADALDRS
ncbi:DivIVA domain-containing protein [Actinomadura flavalba]|uniref:DivIVA domain-containing protein n=1 Tax=Actinomadura flavalba TaxID=1120938 RepID=UPI00037E2956|nr:DivIVA domain-containing protein [Actinomadura flavalba]